MSKQINTSNPECFKLIVFKLLERLSRFHRHIRDINEKHGGSYQAHINELELCLWIILNEICDCNKLFLSNSNEKECDTNSLSERLVKVYSFFRELHEKLIHLPRPSRPVEVVRFCRMMQKGIAGNAEPGINIKMSVDLGELPTQAVYKKTPVEILKNNLQIQIGTAQTTVLEETLSKSVDCHLTIPRIEVKNPCVWATTAHEIAHEVADSSYDRGNDIVKEFYVFIAKNGLNIPAKFQKDETMLKSHLVEYWCDFFGALSMGWGFWFSQIDSMFFAGQLSDKDFSAGLAPATPSHPPCYLRLLFIKLVLRARLKYTEDQHLKDASAYESSLIEQLRVLGRAPYDDDDYNLFQLFQQYAFDSLYTRSKDNSKQITDHLKPLIEAFFKYSDNIESAVVDKLIGSLNNGLPIPSIRADNSTIFERATSVQEILLAAALTKDTHLKDKVISKFDTASQGSDNIADLIESFKRNIDPVFEEFDLCVLRSIQVSEYVDLLVRDQNNSEDKFKQIEESQDADKKKDDNKDSLLIDKLIYKKIAEHEIKIIPFIGLDQIGSTSLDVRLGTSFQVYYPNRSGVIDFTARETLIEAENNSFLMDLDFMESFVLAPGNFILGHTMEYLYLPPNIAAEIEGRSSYARLGIEVHMTAGFVDPGFHGVLTLEIYNAGPNPIRLFPGLRIGQLRFFECSEPAKHYGRNPHAKYKGLLAHRGSLHSNDPEIDIYREKLKALKELTKE